MTYWIGVLFLIIGLAGLILSILWMLLYAESKTTGARKVLYKNDLDIALEMKVNNAWVEMQDAHALDTLQSDTRFNRFRRYILVEPCRT